jgi:hypothetical protein
MVGLVVAMIVDGLESESPMSTLTERDRWAVNELSGTTAVGLPPRPSRRPARMIFMVGDFLHDRRKCA